MEAVIKRSLSFIKRKGTFDPHTEPHHDVTSGQIAFFCMWIICVAVYILRYMRIHFQLPSSSVKTNPKSEEENLIGGNFSGTLMTDAATEATSGNRKTESQKDITPDKQQCGNDVARAARGAPTLDEFLMNVAVFGCIMVVFYLFDYRKV